MPAKVQCLRVTITILLHFSSRAIFITIVADSALSERADSLL
ncbi:MAG: hypothetical protein OFPII_12320 [Osedax symbiont Rs1]|nr:MAG: hypothetical protein OFPII_12320 [Osedax symbiont Rs1]